MCGCGKKAVASVDQVAQQLAREGSPSVSAVSPTTRPVAPTDAQQSTKAS